jgi:hypothetical protein
MAKTNLPANYGDEAKKFRELYEKGSLRTTSGSGTYTSLTSLVTYTYTAGEQDLFTQLSTIVANYNIAQSDWDKLFVGDNSRGSVTLTSPNLNITPLKSGFYYCTNPTNAPYNVGNGYLFHQQYPLDDTICWQTYYQFNAGRVFYRENVSGSWSLWSETFRYTNVSQTQTNVLLFNLGTTRLTNATTNLPSGIISGDNDLWVTVDRISESNNWRKWTLKDIRSGRVWTRSIVNNVLDAYWSLEQTIQNGTSTLKTILGTGSGEWQTPSSNADYPYYTYATVVGATVTTSDKVNISGATLNDFALGSACGIADFTITSAGVNTVTVYSRSLPTSNINILCEVVKG